MVRVSIEATFGPLALPEGEKPKVNVQFFAKKKQFKVFVTIEDIVLAKSFF